MKLNESGIVDVLFVGEATSEDGKLRITNLYLIELQEFDETGKDTLMNRVFPNQKEVFADWFSEEIGVPRGEMLQYAHMSYGSVFEENLFFSSSRRFDR
jgi:hypothetical protein